MILQINCVIWGYNTNTWSCGFDSMFSKSQVKVESLEDQGHVKG